MALFAVLQFSEWKTFGTDRRTLTHMHRSCFAPMGQEHQGVQRPTVDRRPIAPQSPQGGVGPDQAARGTRRGAVDASVEGLDPHGGTKGQFSRVKGRPPKVEGVSERRVEGRKGDREGGREGGRERGREGERDRGREG